MNFSQLFPAGISMCMISTRDYSRGNRSVPKIFDQFNFSSLAVLLINSSHDSSNFEKFVKMFTSSCLLTILINQNAHEEDIAF